MQPDERDAAYLLDMLTWAREAVEGSAGLTFERLLEDKMFKRASERWIEVIGEAARKISKPFRDEHPEIPWSGIIAQRHVIAHDYGDINYGKLWNVLSVHIPELIKLLEPIIPPLPPDPLPEPR